jgi:SpoIIAA-like
MRCEICGARRIWSRYSSSTTSHGVSWPRAPEAPVRPGRRTAQSVLCLGRRATTIMPIAMDHEGGNLFRVEINGTLRKADLDRYQNELVVQMARLGPVKLLFVLEDFEGWEAADNWNDLSFYVKHGGTIQRIAIVGDERWRSETLMFAGADLRTAPVEFFPESGVSEARAWLLA